MASDLTVIPTELRSMSSVLLGVEDALQLLDDLVGSYADDVGDARLEGRLRDVSDDWRRTRDELAEGVRALGDWASQSADAYEQTDTALGQALDPTGQPIPQVSAAEPVVEDRHSGIPVRSRP